MIKVNIVIFFLFLTYVANSQCATKIDLLNKDMILNEFMRFDKYSSDIRSNRMRMLSSASPLNFINVRRIVIKKENQELPNLDKTQWDIQIAIANQAFVQAGIRFLLLDKIDTITSDAFYDFEITSDGSMFNLESETSINIFLVHQVFDSNGSYGGYSSMPYYANTIGENLGNGYIGNSILISHNKFNSDGNTTLSHELGHFFGLLHTFESAIGLELQNGSNSNRSGDLIEDTKANRASATSNYLGVDFGFNVGCPVFDAGVDCNNENITPDRNNFMSYFSNNCRTRFTQKQLDVIRAVAEGWRGYLYKELWGRNITAIRYDNSPKFGGICNGPITIQLKAVGKGVVSWSWSVLGPDATLSSTQEENPVLTINKGGVYIVKLNVIGTDGLPFECNDYEINIPEAVLITNSWPILEKFENGIPIESSGWQVLENFNDCYNFSATNFSAFGAGNRSGVFQNWKSGNDIVSGLRDEYFLTPFFSVDKLSTLEVSFNYSYTYRGLKTDTLIVYILGNCGELLFKTKRGGEQLATASPRLSEFFPAKEEWKNFVLNFKDELDIFHNSNIQKTRIIFKMQGSGGNNLYLDNIRVSGQPIVATNNFSANYNSGLRKMNLAWTDFSNDETSYVVERSSVEDGAWEQIATLPSNADHFDDTPLVPSSIYWYRVKAEGSSLILNYSNISFDTTSDLPHTPTSLVASVSGIKQVSLNWDWGDENLTGFNLFYAFNRNGSYDTLAKLGPGVTSFIHDNVPSNTRIYYFVKAVDHNFSSLPSDTGFVSFLSPTTSTLTKLEYYFDTDPGPGNGIPVNLNSAHAIDRHFEFPVSSLAEGVHQLYFRVQDNIGNWSNVYSNSFIKLKGNAAPTIVDSVEYYFDQFDPGVGKAARIDLTLIAGPEYTIPVELSSLSDGAHILHMRSRNSKGLWSTYWSGGFIKLPGDAVSIIDKVEYFIDSDPGFGLGINVPINSLSKIDTSIHLNLSTVSTGVHKLYLRARDAAGLWSNVFSRNFIRVLGDSGRYVTELEYYFDSEPGIGNGIKVSFPTPKAKVDTVLNLNLAALSDGMHILYVRSKDVAGQWSNIISKSFFRTTGSGGTPKIIKLEYFVDSDPGLGLASNIDTTTLSPGVYDIELPTSSYALGEHNLYIRAKDSRGFWSVVYSGSFRIVNNTECSCAKLVYTTSKVQSATYQWQVDNGSGFQSIADTGVYFGTHTDSLKISNPPTTYAFNKYRCLITSPSGTNFSSTYELRYNMSWNGGENGDWHYPKNWGCIVVPDENVDVVIPGNRPNNPIITKDSKVGSLKIETGSSVTVAPGIKLEIKK